MDAAKPSIIGVRVHPEFRAEIKAEADRHFGGYESLLAREAMRLYLAMRRKFGVQYEPIVAGLLGEMSDEAAA